MLGIARDVITHPELSATMFWLDGEQEAVGWRIFGGIVIPQCVVEIECAGSVFGGAHVKQAEERGQEQRTGGRGGSHRAHHERRGRAARAEDEPTRRREAAGP